MPYVSRDHTGVITALHKNEQAGATEFLPADDDEVKAFLGAPASEVTRALQNSDTELARITEDLIQLLVSKNLICFTDLPEAVQSKLVSREQLRARLTTASDSLLSDDETI